MVISLESNNKEVVNYLINQKSPQTKTSQMYFPEKQNKNDFSFVTGPESHLRRRRLILEKHPEIAKLLVPSKPYSLILAVLLVTLNLYIAYLIKDSSWSVILTVVYVFGGMIGHTCHVLVHDFTHLSGHPNILVNKAFAIFVNIATGIPSAISFGIYHSDHHNFMGEENKDADIPTRWESEHFKSRFGKFMFFMLLPIIYVSRPFFYMHKKMTPEEIVNAIIVICADILIYKFWGVGALAYVLITGPISIGAHPAAIHTIAEHHEFVKGIETYDYFGIWNFFNLNLGYHTEHHDFPSCPWYNLPAIRAAAPEWYEYLPHHTSYMQVLIKFVVDKNINLYNRTLRIAQKKHQ